MKIIVVVFTIFATVFYGRGFAQDKNPVGDMPIRLFHENGNKGLVLYLSGDGGWSKFNEQIVQGFAKKGYSVVALNTRKYFWNQSNPDAFSRDMEQLVVHYLKEWGKAQCIVVGYSFGADVAAFLPGRMHKAKAPIVMSALIAPSYSTDFVIHISDLLIGKETKNYRYKTKAEIQKGLVPTLCIFGAEENLSLQKELTETTAVHVLELPGKHHFDDGADKVVDEVLSFYTALKK